MLLYVDSQFASPYAMSAFVALRTKELEFEMRCIDLSASENLTREYSTASLTARVPTLVNGTFALSESSAISEYLEELHPDPRLYPADTEERARARQVQAWLRSDLLPLRQDRSTEVVFYRPASASLTPAGSAAAEKLVRIAGSLLAHGGDNLFGEWCIADTDLALMLNRLVLNGDPVPAQLSAYASRQWQHPAVQEWVGQRRPPL
jgi:glutathione S-transferase